MSYEPALLISGGGDAEIKVWEWMKGTLRWELRVWEIVDKFLVIKAVRRSGSGEEGDGEGKVQKKRRKRKGKEREKEKERTGDGEADGNDQGNDSSVDNDATKPSKVLVIQQIDSVASGSTVYILFSAVGLFSSLLIPACFELNFCFVVRQLFLDFPSSLGCSPVRYFTLTLGSRFWAFPS